MKRKDFAVGQVCITENGNQYVVIAVRTGEVDLLNAETLNSIYLDNDDMIIGKGKAGKRIVKVLEYDAVPARNRVSAALRDCRGIGTKYDCEEVWTANKLSDEDVENIQTMIEQMQKLLAKAGH